MKETIKVNLSGVIFYIDEDGYEKLKNYLDKISNHFKDKNEGKEIIDDIESRIAELFKDKLNNSKKVIPLSDVDSIITGMGEPEESINDSTDEPNEERTYQRTEKRLYRDPENSMLGGVASGLASYFNIDTVWLRLAFVFLIILNGFGLLLYIVLWAFVPPARTTSERLEMKGEKITISNIEKTVKEEYEKVKDNFSNIKNSKSYNRINNFFEDFFRALGLFFKFLFRFIIGVIGIGIIIAGFGLLIAFIAVFFLNVSFIPFSNSEIHNFISSEILESLFTTTSFSFFLLVAFLTFSIPLIALIYGGIKLIFRFKVNDKLLGRSILILWILSALIFTSQLIIEGRNFRTHRSIIELKEIEKIDGNTLYISINEIDMNIKNAIKLIWYDENRLFYNEEKDQIFGAPSLDIERSYNDNYQIEMKIQAFGSNSKEARENASNVIYHWELSDSLIEMDPYYFIPEGEKWYMVKMKITIKVPNGKSIYLNTSCEKYLYEVDNHEKIWEENMINKKWKMEDKGLSLIE